MHDKLYQLGFTESAGNFQFANVFNGVDRGGTGGDPVLADAQDSRELGFFNNAQMTTYYEDGISPSLEMFLWNAPAYDRDGDLDAEIILHEYTHGLSTRRVGGGGGIWHLQSSGMGEGWSDFMALALLSESSDGVDGNYAASGYVTHQLAGLQENYYYGIRRYPYTTNLSKNPLTFKDIDRTQADPHVGIPRNPITDVPGGISSQADEVHNIGEVWCAMLWEVRASLVAKLGFAVGNQIALQLVVDGMNLAPVNPTFVQARDAMLQAEQILTAGQHQTNLWAAFAKRGLGYSAAAPQYPYSTMGVVEAFDLPTPGGQLWTYQTGNSIYSSPALGPDGMIYFGSTDGKLYALNPDGTKKWDFSSATNAFGGLSPIYSSPAVGPEGPVYVGSYDKKLYAINPDGTLKWSFTASNVIFSSPAIGVDGAVYFGCSDGKLYVLNSDGTLRWTFVTAGAIYSSPAIDKNQVVYVGSADNKLYAINPNGTQKWAVTHGNWVYASPAVDYSSAGVDPAIGAVYYGCDDGTIVRRNAANGTIVWSFETEGRVVSSPVLDVEGNVYAGSEDGKLYSLTPGGILRWSFQAGDIIYSSPAVGWDGRVYFAAYDRKLYVLRTNGTLLSSFLLGGDVYSSPVVGFDGRIYLGSLDAKLYAYPAETTLAPSAWPMFRNDARHLGNQSFIWFDGGGFLPNGSFRFGIHSSIYSSVQYEVPVLLERSDNLINWNSVVIMLMDQGEGFRTFAQLLPGQNIVFYRAKAQSASYPRSRNPYGYIKLTLPAGFSMISNPLNTRNNTLNGLFPDMPADTQFLKWNVPQQTYDTFYFDPIDGWLPDAPLLPGEGGFIFNPTAGPITVTFIGEVLQGHLTKTIPAGVSIRSSMVPQAGGITSLLGFGPEDGLTQGDRLDRYKNNSYDNYAYLSGAWYRTNPPPTILLEPAPAVGEAFWLKVGGSRNWKRTFSVWP